MGTIRTTLFALLLPAASGCASAPSTGSPLAQHDGEQLYQDRCGRCHDAVPRHGYLASEWPAIVQRMRSEARLSADETRRILRWLQEGQR